jgi:hypothetical protein
MHHAYHPENRFWPVRRYNRFRQHDPNSILPQLPRIIQTIAPCIKSVQGGKLGKSNSDSTKHSTRTHGATAFTVTTG